jgi:hypothetical protein
MMTGATLASGDLRLLLSEVATARQLLSQLAAEIESVRKQHPGTVSREVLALLAVDLHSYYTKLESLLERILVSFEGHTPRRESGHAGMLRVASLAVPGIRPAIFGPSVRDALDELRKFRHFFRHAYALDLRSDKLDRVLELFMPAYPVIDEELVSFVAFVEATIAQLDAAP